jgi:putative membrane protein
MMMGFGMMGGMLFFWVAIIIFSVLVVKGLFNSGDIRVKDIPNNARHILEERYARGEITQEQYQTILRDIS